VFCQVQRRAFRSNADPIPSCHHLEKKPRITLTIACVAGAERGEKREEIIRKREQRAYFGRILHFRQATAKIVIGHN